MVDTNRQQARLGKRCGDNQMFEVLPNLRQQAERVAM